MEHERKKKHHNGKRKQNQIDSSMDEKPQKKKISKVKSVSNPKEFTQKRISLHALNYIPAQIYEFDNLIKEKNLSHEKEDNYYEIVTKKRQELKKIDDEIDEQYENKKIILEFLNEIENNKNMEEKKCYERINEIGEERNNLKILNDDLDTLLKELEKIEITKNSKKKLYDNSQNLKCDDINLMLTNIENEKNNLNQMHQQNIEKNKKISEIFENITKYEEEINQEKNKGINLSQNKNELKEKYQKINQIAINDNKFCHDNFYSLLPLFPYYKNVAFISKENDINNNKYENKTQNIDDNKMIIDEKSIEDIENENIKKIKALIKQKEEHDKNINFKILKDRRTLQINFKEKYKFQKIFSIINNNYIAEPWDINKFSSFKLFTINSYFNEFNMTAISNNYFIIYLTPALDKSCLKGELYSLFQQLKNNEYIDKNIVIKISAITESNYINISNINQENNIKNQITSISASGAHSIYGFLYEFTKSNRLNKKNMFRIYNFDYSYPQVIEMMTSITKYYAKKKRKKTGVYKKVIRQGNNQNKNKKRPVDKSVNNTNNNAIKNNNLINKGNLKNNNVNGVNKKTNLNKVQFKKNTNSNANNNRISTLTNINQNNKSFIGNNKGSNKKDNKKVLNVSSLDNKKIIKKSGSNHQSNKKEKNAQLSSKNNMKVVKFDNKSKSITPKKMNSESKNTDIKKIKFVNVVFNDLKLIKPEHTLIIHDINSEFVQSNEFKKVVKACGILNNNDK